MSNIDFACDLILGKDNRESYTASKDRFKFPNNDNQISIKLNSWQTQVQIYRCFHIQNS